MLGFGGILEYSGQVGAGTGSFGPIAASRSPRPPAHAPSDSRRHGLVRDWAAVRFEGPLGDMMEHCMMRRMMCGGAGRSARTPSHKSREGLCRVERRVGQSRDGCSKDASEIYPYPKYNHGFMVAWIFKSSGSIISFAEALWACFSYMTFVPRLPSPLYTREGLRHWRCVWTKDPDLKVY